MGGGRKECGYTKERRGGLADAVQHTRRDGGEEGGLRGDGGRRDEKREGGRPGAIIFGPSWAVAKERIRVYALP